MQQKQTTVGQHIRDKVIPSGMSVKEAAARLGVGRPALSNLLNGKASLSPKMALRLERAFGADGDALLELQAKAAKARRRDEEKGVAVRGYVPSFLKTKANDIERWAEPIGAREHLPVLLRKLVHATGRDLERVDFPGFDNSQRPGWDGRVEAGTATAWIPEGMSGWEFGTSKRPHQKAETDYGRRLALPLEERRRCTFIFVTPRNWPGRDIWAKEKEAAGDGWKAVRAYDASDLEQWLDESIAAPVWLAEMLPTPIAGVKTLEKIWGDWAAASKPALTKSIFESNIAVCVKPFKEWLERPPELPFVVAADSQDEALAFLACLFEHEEIPAAQRDLAAVFTSSETLTRLAASSSPFIPIAGNEATQESLAALCQRVHCIATCPRNAVDPKPDFALDLLDSKAFGGALADMGLERHRAHRLARESGRSPTILRRRLSRVPCIRAPRWAKDTALARSLIPMCLVGAWHDGGAAPRRADAHKSADQEVLRTLADCKEYEDVERHVACLQQLEDCPVWSVGQHRGVTSKVDVLFAVARLMTEQDIKDFLTLAEYVLSESDPRLELPETDRWAAAIHGKVRDHSDALRNGICETLVLLSLHGDGLFRERLGIDVKALVSNLVTRLLTPLDEKLPSQERDLPAYAEAAPDRFLETLEEDLRKDEPAVLSLLKPVASQLFARCPRTGLLRALECLAWNPDYLARVCVLIAGLSRNDINDNWTKPTETLAGILRSWMPQTAASVDDRIVVLKMLIERFPAIGWRLCLDEISVAPHWAAGNYRPQWRSDAAGVGGVASERDIEAFMRCAASVLLRWPDHDQATLGDLVEHVEQIEKLLGHAQSSVWELIDDWGQGQNDDEAKAELRERIRLFALTRRGRRNLPSTNERARVAYESLRPRAPAVRHAWLFANSWVEDSWDEVEDEELDLEARWAKIDGLRHSAMKEIWGAHGLAGALTMVKNGSDGFTVGRYAALCATDAAGVLKECLSIATNVAQFDAFMQAFIGEHPGFAEFDMLLDVSQQVDRERAVRLWRCAPFQAKTWRMLDRLAADVQGRYWRTVSPDRGRLAEAECTEIVDRLLAARRPHAAFNAMEHRWENVGTDCLRRLLTAIASGDAVSEDVVPIESWHVSDALEALQARPSTTNQEMASLEFAFIEALGDHSEHGIPNLERLIEDSPSFFVRMLSHCFERGDGGQDPAEWRILDPERRQVMARRAYSLLRQAARIPGTDANGAIQVNHLLRWLEQTRELCAEVGRAGIGDQVIGELLSKAPADEDGAWPCHAVCKALEMVASTDIQQGFTVGKFNSRGPYFRRIDEGGDQEREISAQYRSWAQQRRAEHPFASRVVSGIAKWYDKDAKLEDEQDTLRKRLDTL